MPHLIAAPPGADGRSAAAADAADLTAQLWRLRGGAGASAPSPRPLTPRAEVVRVLYPALPDDPGHALWKRDLLGASGLFGVVLKPASKKAVYALIEALDLSGIGASWGGFESLIQPTTPARIRTETRWQPEGPSLRLHIGREDLQDLIDRGPRTRLLRARRCRELTRLGPGERRCATG